MNKLSNYFRPVRYITTAIAIETLLIGSIFYLAKCHDNANISARHKYATEILNIKNSAEKSQGLLEAKISQIEESAKGRDDNYVPLEVLALIAAMITPWVAVCKYSDNTIENAPKNDEKK